MTNMFSPQALVLSALFALHHLLYVEGIPDRKFVSPPSSPNNIITLDYTKTNAFAPGDSVIKRIDLAPGDEMTIVCSGPSMDGGNELTMYPSDPINKVLAPLGDARIADAILREFPKHVAYRSNDMIVVENTTMNPRGFLIRYPTDTIIMANDPRTFSLNFACKWSPKNGNAAIYRWVQVTFKSVYPMAYGCETGRNILFKNTNATNLRPGDYATDPLCRIEPNPGMIIGIYCRMGETIQPPNCIHPDTLAKYGGGLTPFMMPIRNSLNTSTSLASRVMLYRVPSDGLQKTVQLSCSCVNHSGAITKTLLIDNNSYEKLDIVKRIVSDEIGVESRNYHHIEYLRPGSKYSFIVPIDGKMHLEHNHYVDAHFLPERSNIETLYVGVVGGINEAAPLNKYIGSKGLDITKSRNGPTMYYHLRYKKNAIVVMKSRTLNVFYVLELLRVNPPINAKSLVSLEFGILPTDPYTYGCGVQSRDLFHEDLTVIEDRDEGTDHGFTQCLVNAHEVNPIGFYCPKGYRLEPPDCFNHMIMRGSDELVPVSQFAPHARAIPGNNIRVLDTNSSNNYDNAKYETDIFMCKCFDKDDKERARIHISFDIISREQLRDTYGEVETNLLWDP